MVALYFPSLTAPNAFGLAFEDDPTSYMFAEDFNDCSNLDPYHCWDADNLIIPPLISNDLPLPCTGGGHLSSPAASSGYSAKTTEEASLAGNKNKKQSHNASERMRRMKINGLYSSLRALLPNSQHMKKLSIPNTVDRVVKYIPELQKEVQGLVLRKEELLPALGSSVTYSETIEAYNNKECSTTCSYLVQATQLGNGEISVQISTPKSFVTTLIPISEVLRELEEDDGLFVIDVSSSESSVGRVFHNFHLMALEANQKVIKCDVLKEKLLSQCQKWEQLCLWMIAQGLS